MLKIIQFIKHTLEVSSVKLPYSHLGRILIPILNLTDMLSYIIIFIIKHIITLIAIIESVYKYLVHNCTLCPLRCLKSWCNLEIIIRIKIFNRSNLIVITHRSAKLYLKIIIYFVCSDINLSLIIIKHAL